MRCRSLRLAAAAAAAAAGAGAAAACCCGWNRSGKAAHPKHLTHPPTHSRLTRIRGNDFQATDRGHSKHLDSVYRSQ